MSKLFQRIVVFAAVWLICIRLGVLLTILAVLGSDTTPPVGSGLTGAAAWFWAASESDAQAERTAIVSSRILNWECTGTAVATVFCLLQRWKDGLRVGMAHPRDSEVQARIEMHAHIVGPGKGLGGRTAQVVLRSVRQGLGQQRIVHAQVGRVVERIGLHAFQ